VDATQKSLALFMQIVAKCQDVGILRPGPVELMAVTVWGAIHGLVMLRLEGQLPHTALENWDWPEMLIFTLGQMTQVPIPENILSGK